MFLLYKLNNVKFNIAKLLGVMIAVLTLSGCGAVDPKDTTKLSVVTVIFPQYDLVRAVAGDKAEITMLTDPGAEIHGFEPSLGDIRSIQEADVFVYGGGESDVWVNEILHTLGRKDLITVRLMDFAELLKEENASNHSHSHDEHHHMEGCDIHKSYIGYDEHIWTSPKNHLASLTAVCDAICLADKVNSEYYIGRKAAYAKELDSIAHELEETVKSSAHSFIALGDRFPFLYLAHDLNLEYVAVFPGCSHENDASPSVMIKTIEEIKKRKLKVVFKTETSDGRIANTLSEETGTKVMTLHSCQSISPRDFESGVTYAELMRGNIQSLKEALN